MTVQDRFEKFAMSIETISQQEKKWIDVDKAGADLGLSSHESRKLADLLVDEGWATINALSDGIKLRLTKSGFDEIAKFHWPVWRRWIDKHPTVKTAIISALISIPVSLFIVLLTHLLWPQK